MIALELFWISRKLFRNCICIKTAKLSNFSYWYILRVSIAKKRVLETEFKWKKIINPILEIFVPNADHAEPKSFLLSSVTNLFK